MKPYLATNQYLPAIVIMTDGRSEQHRGFDDAWRQEGHRIPIFGVTFGGADLTEAFRSVRGYN
jgi:Ca-activated chloride channel family protein